MKFSKIYISVIFLCILISGQQKVAAQREARYPIPFGNVNQLFFVQRDPNINTLIYELNLKNGAIVEDDPIHVFWIRYAEKGQHDELNYIQRNFAYGIKSKMINKDYYEIHFVSYKKKLMFLKKTSDNKFFVFTDINKKQAILKQVFLRVKGGSFWVPNIEYVELKGIDPVSGLEVIERMKI
ncbi:MAG: DUF4833 domain-containing protein [Bacteroidetes bacterium]|nr:DUF4833 domain-containing protein [Bacteroidota bacterium]